MNHKLAITSIICFIISGSYAIYGIVNDKLDMVMVLGEVVPLLIGWVVLIILHIKLNKNQV